MTTYYRPKEVGALLADVEDLAKEYGTKAAYLTVFPKKWTPEYVLISAAEVLNLVNGGVAFEAPSEFRAMAVIVRSSIVGETIWERGSYSSIVHATPPTNEEIFASIKSIYAQACEKSPGVGVGIVLQRYVVATEKGQVGNLNRLNKTREQWTITPEVEFATLTQERFNAQRDAAADPRKSLNLNKGLPRQRVFGSACRWLTDRFTTVQKTDRMLMEWTVAEDQLFLLQLDLDSDNATGVDPDQLAILNRLAPASVEPRIIRVPNLEDIATWDKLKILQDLASDTGPPPQRLFVLTGNEAVRVLLDETLTANLTQDFEALCDTFAMIRTTHRTGAAKTTNLPVTTRCLSSEAAINWLRDALQAIEALGKSPDELAFVIHKFVGAKSGAWALYDPASPYIQIHANWGLPDALQYYPYDSWDVHVLTEDIVDSPAYKTHFLWAKPDGDWCLQEVKNSVARHQSLKQVEVREIARRTYAIGSRLGRTVAIMWFAGAETNDGTRICIPWYRTFEYETPTSVADAGSDYLVVAVSGPVDLDKAKAAAKKLPEGRKLAIDIKPTPDLIRDPSFLEAIIKCAQTLDATVIYSGSPFSHPYYQLHGAVPIHLRLERRTFRTRNLIKYHKLVRDKIPDRIRARDERVVFANLKQGEILKLLAGKLIEEAQELAAAENMETSAEELADVYEVLRGMMHQIGVDEAQVIKIADQKRDRVGGFDKGIFLLETSLPKPGEPYEELLDVDFSTLVREEYRDKILRLPFSLLGTLTDPGRTFPIPGSDRGIHVHLAKDGVDLSITSVEHQFSFSFAGTDDFNQEDEQ